MNTVQPLRSRFTTVWKATAGNHQTISRVQKHQMKVRNNDKPLNNVNEINERVGDVAFGSGELRCERAAESAASKVVNMRNPREMRIGTWNVRTMGQKAAEKKEKMENAVREMKRCRLNVLGLCEVKWKTSGDCYFEGYRFINVGGGAGRNGVAIVLDPETAKRVTNVVVDHGDRLVKVKVEAEPKNLIIVQVYMPTSDHDDEEIENMYEKIQDLISTDNADEQLIVMGDWNAEIGEGGDGKEVGQFGLGKRNERGARLVEFAKKNKLVVTNTCYQQHARRRYTWQSPGDRARYQLDYILARQRYRNNVKCSWSYPGADIGSDHNLVMMKVGELRLKKIRKHKRRLKWDMEKAIEHKDAFRDNVESQLSTERVVLSANEKWIRLRDVIIEGAKKEIGYEKKKKIKKPWITEQMLKKMDERRAAKRMKSARGKTKYRALNNELRREAERAYEEWWTKELNELELLERHGKTEILYRIIKDLTEEKKAKSNSKCIKDNNGVILKEPDEIKSRWREYIEELYDKSGKPGLEEFNLEREETVNEDDKGPQLLDDEIESAINELKCRKAEGVDGIPAEFLKALGERGRKELGSLCRHMYETGEWPEDFVKSSIVTLEKKTNATECADHRTIALISHASKIVLKIILRRLETKANYFIGKSQFGFRKGRGTREAIAAMRIMCERSLEFGNDLFICFVDYEKAFDRLKWTKLMDILKRIGIDWRDRRLITNLYMNQTAVVRTEHGDSEPGEMGRGVRQGCLLSPLLFSIYAEMMMKEAMEGVDGGVKIGGELVTDVKFADDQGMVATTEEGLQNLMDALSRTGELYDMKINVKKTKVMRVRKKIRADDPKINIVINGEVVEQVQQFRYLGSLITEEGTCEAEIKSRIAMAKDAFNKRRELLTNRLSKELKKKIVKTLVWSVALYGSEAWTLRQDERRRLEAFEMWCWRTMEKISWRAHTTNEAVLELVGEERKILDVILKRKKRWLGHMLRGESLVKDIMEGRFEGKRGVGRPRETLLGDIIIKGDDTYETIKRRASDRQVWRIWMPRTCPRAEHQ